MSSLEELERRVTSGEPGAQFALAVSLLSGRDGQIDAPRASELLDTASAAGHAAATEMIASLEAMGTGRVQSWQRALDYLLLATQQGSETAREQILLLSSNEEDPVAPFAATPDYWTERLRRIDIDSLTRAPQRRSLSEDPRIRAINGFATGAECRWLISRARDRLKPALVFHPQTGEFIQDPGRNNTGVEFSTTNMDVVTEVIRARIASATKLPVPVFEPPHLLHYSVGQEFSPHVDFLDPANPAYAGLLGYYGQRIATFLIYLNDDFEGGETDFPAIGLRFKGRTGDALFFANVDRSNQPDQKTVHAGLAPTAGEKWIFSQWIRNQARGVGSPA